MNHSQMTAIRQMAHDAGTLLKQLWEHRASEMEHQSVGSATPADFASQSLAVQEAGGVAECLDGSSFPWNQVRMPPLLSAANQRISDEVRKFVQY